MFRSMAHEAFMRRAAHEGTHGITDKIVNEFDAATPRDKPLPPYANAKKRLIHTLLPPRK